MNESFRSHTPSERVRHLHVTAEPAEVQELSERAELIGSIRSSIETVSDGKSRFKTWLDSEFSKLGMGSIEEEGTEKYLDMFTDERLAEIRASIDALTALPDEGMSLGHAALRDAARAVAKSFQEGIWDLHSPQK